MSIYPDTIFSPRETENLPGLSRSGATGKALKQNLFSEDYQDLGGEINALQTILGTLPSGSFASVRAWLEMLDALPRITTGIAPPENPRVGDLWYDTN
jgi:hypothetical protein